MQSYLKIKRGALCKSKVKVNTQYKTFSLNWILQLALSLKNELKSEKTKMENILYTE